MKTHFLISLSVLFLASCGGRVDKKDAKEHLDSIYKNLMPVGNEKQRVDSLVSTYLLGLEAKDKKTDSLRMSLIKAEIDRSNAACKTAISNIRSLPKFNSKNDLDGVVIEVISDLIEENEITAIIFGEGEKDPETHTKNEAGLDEAVKKIKTAALKFNTIQEAFAIEFGIDNKEIRQIANKYSLKK